MYYIHTKTVYPACIMHSTGIRWMCMMAWYTPHAHALSYLYIYHKTICKLKANTWQVKPLTASCLGLDSIIQR